MSVTRFCLITDSRIRCASSGVCVARSRILPPWSLSSSSASVDRPVIADSKMGLADQTVQCPGALEVIADIADRLGVLAPISSDLLGRRREQGEPQAGVVCPELIVNLHPQAVIE